MRWSLYLVTLLVALALGAGLMWLFERSNRPPLPETPVLVERIRTTAQLEALEVSAYKKISFEPEPTPTDSLWGDVSQWARFTFRAPRGKAIVFADIRIGIDLEKLDAGSIVRTGDILTLRLPPLLTRVELKPGETEFVASNLSSDETAQLFQRAREAFQKSAESNPALQDKARSSVEKALRRLLLDTGFREVRFEPPAPGRS